MFVFPINYCQSNPFTSKMNEINCVLNAENHLKMVQEYYIRIKDNLKNILESVKFCGICLASYSEGYFYLLDFPALPDDDNITLEQMFCEVFSDQISTEILSKYICNICTEKVKQSYMFLCEVKNNSIIVNKFLQQISDQVDEVTSLIDVPTHNIGNVIISIEGFDPSLVNKEEIKEEITETDFLICDYCAKSFKTKRSLKKHITEKHLNQSPNSFKIKCTECLSTNCIHEKYLISMQEQKLAGCNKLRCLDCDNHVSNAVSMIAHVNREHLNICPYLCETCGRAFPCKKSQRIHMKQFHAGDKHICLYCDRRFGSKEVLYSHLEQCQHVTRKYVCKLCPASFNSQQSLQMHQEKHVSKFQCPMCSKSYHTYFTLLRHKKCMHEIITKPPRRQRPDDRICSICPARFTKLTELTDHLRTHGPNEKHKCELCHKEFESRKAYTGHTRSYPHLKRLDPTTNFSFPCVDCDKSFPSAKMLENHRNLIHLKIKPYICQTCSKAFTTATHLKHHLQVHEGTKKYQCSHCSIMLTTLSSLKKHVLRYHSEKKPFVCDMCDKSFVCKSELLQHSLKIHSGMKVPCPLCGADFRHRSNLKSHIYKVHLRDRDLQEFLAEQKHNTELVELMRDRRIQLIT